MTLRSLSALVLTAGVAVGGAIAQEPGRLPSANQQLANSVAEQLMKSGVAEAADVTIHTVSGVVTITGTVKSDSQRQAILAQARTVSGVSKVADALSTAAITQVKAQDGGLAIPGLPIQQPLGPVVGGPIVGTPPPAGLAIDPVPLGAAGMGQGDMGAPPLPPHAWPTYAPYNNVSRVAYPTAYPHNAFPFIGPFYPFPKVPLGWRSVQLQWEDGHWWLGRTQAPQDYWRVRFW
ncbi:MAG: BON domain-containing protein [Gemmataceae bacterium]